MSLGADIRTLTTRRAFGVGSPRQIDPVFGQHRAESQRDHSVAAALGTKDQVAHGGTRRLGRRYAGKQSGQTVIYSCASRAEATRRR